jgi:uncharacterized protein (TIGR02996 family)
MKDEAGFLAAITAARQDASLRLVYGDWLEERGDPRSELVRIEEEMRQLPVFSDRFWELKPRRNELRAQAPTEWLETMGYGSDCQPVFAHGVPDGWKERWRLIREYTERWHRIPLGDVGGRVKEIRAVEKRLGQKLPPSVREWVAFAHDVRRDPRYHFVLEDFYQMDELAEHSAVSLLFQSEGDCLWAVRTEDFALPDPPVQQFSPDFESAVEEEEPAFIPDEVNPIGETVTAWALDYAIASTRAPGGGFRVDVAKPARLIRDLTAAFPFRCSLGGMELFEAENMLVRVCPSEFSSGNRIAVEVAKPLPREAIPSFLWACTRKGGSFHGMFIPERS